MERYLGSQGINISSKALHNEVLSLSFADVADLDQAFAIIQKEWKTFSLTRKDLEILISLSTSEKNQIIDAATDKAIDILRNRLDALDVRGLNVTKQGSSKLVVGLPGVEDISDIKDAILRAAKLEFKLVHDSAHSEKLLLDRFDGILPSDKMIALEHGEDGRAYLVSIFADISGARITDARQVFDPSTNRPAVTFFLDAEGAKDFREVTRENIGSQLAVIMDGKVIQAPVIQSEIGRERNGQITGSSQKESLRMAQLLRSGSLASALKIEQEVRVGASLGTDSIVKGLTSCLLSLLMLLIFSILYYKTSGVLACLALAYNILILLLMLAFLKATLTLPGIAGIVLTVGMAIDASILIFERIKEELKTGLVNYATAVEAGFSGAMGVILDSNITTFVAGAVLFWYGGASVRGFAVTLMVGIVSTVITGVFFLKSIFDFCTKVLRWEKISI
jgi:preprotein translocase subunit SecD